MDSNSLLLINVVYTVLSYSGDESERTVGTRFLIRRAFKVFHYC